MRDKTSCKLRVRSEVNNISWYLRMFKRDINSEGQVASERRIRYWSYMRSAVASSIKYLSNIQ